MRFDIAISLGEACQTRKQLSIELEKRFGSDAGGGAFFFDWLARDQGLGGVCRAITSGFELRREDFTARGIRGHVRLYNVRYGLTFQHDMRFAAAQPGPAADSELDAAYPALAAKYEHLARKTRDVLASNAKVLFLLCGKVTLAEAEGLALVLRGVDFKVLHMPYTNRQQAGVQHPDFIVSPIHFVTYPGHTESWANALAPFDLPKIDDFEVWMGRQTTRCAGLQPLAAGDAQE